MFAEQQREYLDKGYTKIESFFSAEEVAKILEDVSAAGAGCGGHRGQRARLAGLLRLVGHSGCLNIQRLDVCSDRCMTGIGAEK
jgi:hypothetical protein